MIDVDEHFGRLVANEGHLLLDWAKTSIVEKLEAGKHCFPKSQLRTLWIRLFVQHASSYLPGGYQVSLRSAQPLFWSRFRSALKKPVLLPGLPAETSRIGLPSDITSRNLPEFCAQFALGLPISARSSARARSPCLTASPACRSAILPITVRVSVSSPPSKRPRPGPNKMRSPGPKNPGVIAPLSISGRFSGPGKRALPIVPTPRLPVS